MTAHIANERVKAKRRFLKRSDTVHPFDLAPILGQRLPCPVVPEDVTENLCQACCYGRYKTNEVSSRCLHHPLVFARWSRETRTAARLHPHMSAESRYGALGQSFPVRGERIYGVAFDDGGQRKRYRIATPAQSYRILICTLQLADKRPQRSVLTADPQNMHCCCHF